MATIKSYITKSGIEKWEYSVSNGRNKGTGLPQKIHKRGFKNKTEAENAAKILEGQIASGNYKKLNPEKMTISEFFDTWINEYKSSVKEGTRIVHRSNIKVYIKPYIGNYKLHQYNRTEHQKFINTLLTKNGLGRSGKGLSLNTVKVVNATISNAFKKAIQLGYVTENPTQFTEFPKPTSVNTPNFYSIEEADTFLEYAKKERESLWYPFFLLIFDCGLRKAEAMALRWSDINLQNRVINITKERLYRAEMGENIGAVALDDTKTPAGKRTVVMTNRTQQAFINLYNEFYQTSGLIPVTAGNDTFTFILNNGNLVRARSVNGAFDRIIKRAGLKKIKVHDGRHTYAVRLRQAGVPLEDIKDLLGHKDVSTTQIYAHVSPIVKERAVGKLDDFLANHEKKVVGEIIDFNAKKDS